MGCRSIRREEEVVEGAEETTNSSTEVTREEVNDRIHNRVEIHKRRAYPVINPLPIKNGLNPTRVQVPMDEGAPVKAIDFLSRVIQNQRHRHPDDDEAAVYQRFLDKEVVLDSGEPVAPDYEVPPGRFLNFYRRPAPEREVPGTLGLLYEDNDLLVVDKPSFLATLPRGQHIAQTALTKARIQFGIPELSPCHRLDRLTRGVLMFTKRPEIRGAYQTLFDRREPQKTYEAITDVPNDPPLWLVDLLHAFSAPALRGIPWQQEFQLVNHPDFQPGCQQHAQQQWQQHARQEQQHAQQGWQYNLHQEDAQLPEEISEVEDSQPWREREQPSRKRPWVLRHHMVKVRGRLATYLTGDEPNAETAITGVRAFLDTSSSPVPATRLAWRLEPHSGRTHQLRVVMRSLGMPIVNDSLYGFISNDALQRPDGDLPSPAFVEDEDFTRPMGLTAKELSFRDPLTGKLRQFNSRF